MNLADTEQKNASDVVVATNVNTRLTGPWLIIARVVWLALVIPSLGLFVASLIVSYQQMQTVCVDLVTCNNSAGALTPQLLQTLRNEVDLNQLSEHLITVVQETMQPAHVSSWLRKSGHERKPDTQVE